MQQLIQVTLDNNVIDLRFNDYWYQEDIEELYNNIKNILKDVSLLESTLGADRHNYRLLRNETYLILNFDCYSQSCWIEVETEKEVNHLDNVSLILQNEITSR